MKKFRQLAGTIAILHLLCFWTGYALLQARWSHFSVFEFFGLLPAPPPSPFAVFVQWVFIVLGAPASVLLDGLSSAYFLPALILCSVLNSIFWGICLAWPIYEANKRFRQIAA